MERGFSLNSSQMTPRTLGQKSFCVRVGGAMTEIKIISFRWWESVFR